MRNIKQLLTVSTLTLLLTGTAIPADAGNPAMRADGTWISLSGTVTSVMPDTFVLDYGDGDIIVEMDDGDRDADAYKLIAGDKVTVNGVIDHDFYETRTIEASTVFVEKLGTTFYSSAMDEEDHWLTLSSPVIISSTVLEGTVKDVANNEFLLELGSNHIEVEVDEMAYNPLDDEGYHKVEQGDRVRVYGEMDYELFDGHVFNARTIITLSDHSRMSNS